VLEINMTSGFLFELAKRGLLSWSAFTNFILLSEHLSDSFRFLLLPQKKAPKKRGNLNMLSHAHAGTRPRLSYAIARLTL
jgi:hypothetical protein